MRNAISYGLDDDGYVATLRHSLAELPTLSRSEQPLHHPSPGDPIIGEPFLAHCLEPLPKMSLLQLVPFILLMHGDIIMPPRSPVCPAEYPPLWLLM